MKNRMKTEPLTSVEQISKIIAEHFESRDLVYSEVLGGATVKVSWGSHEAPLKVPNPYLGKWVLVSLVRTDVKLDSFELVYQLFKPDSYCIALAGGMKIPNTRLSKLDALKELVTDLNAIIDRKDYFPGGVRFIVVPDPEK